MDRLIVNSGVHNLNGDIGTLEARGGVFYVNGNVGKLIHYGGIINKSAPKVGKVEIVSDQISKRERQRLNDRIADLEARLAASQRETDKLRQRLGEQKAKEPTPSDDALIHRIESLQRQLDREREGRKREVEDLKYNLDGVKEAYFDLLHQHNEEARDARSREIAERHIDILATMMALYPFTPDKDLVFEFGVPTDRIRETARVLGLIKSKEARLEAVEYLHRQHREMIERRGGDQTKNTKPKKKR